MDDLLKIQPSLGTEGREIQKLENLKTKLSSHGVSEDRTKAEKAAEDFEALLLKQMIGEMWKSVPSSGLLSGSREEELYRDFMNDELAKSMASENGLGLKKMIVDEMERRSNGQEPE